MTVCKQHCCFLCFSLDTDCRTECVTSKGNRNGSGWHVTHSLTMTVMPFALDNDTLTVSDALCSNVRENGLFNVWEYSFWIWEKGVECKNGVSLKKRKDSQCNRYVSLEKKKDRPWM